MLEGPIYLIALRAPTPWRQGLVPAIGLAIGLQLATHPALWYLAPRFEPYPLWLLSMEALVTLTEAAILGSVLYRTTRTASKTAARPGSIATALFALGLAAIANTFSALIGLVML